MGLLGSAHALYLALRRGHGGPGGTAAHQERREQARRLLHDHPETARQLAVGRPDLPRWFDDGGLVDVNQVPAAVLAELPGVSPETAHAVVAGREAHGPHRGRPGRPRHADARLAHELGPRLICAAGRVPAV